MEWEILDDRPVYIQLVEELEKRIFNSTYLPGTKLLSVRDLASEAYVNPNTMQRALGELESRGLIYSKRTAGNFITDDADLIERVKKQRAKGVCSDFLMRMQKLGISKEQTIKIIEEEEFE